MLQMQLSIEMCRVFMRPSRETLRGLRLPRARPVPESATGRRDLKPTELGSGELPKNHKFETFVVSAVVSFFFVVHG